MIILLDHKMNVIHLTTMTDEQRRALCIACKGGTKFKFSKMKDLHTFISDQIAWEKEEADGKDSKCEPKVAKSSL